MIGNQVTTPLIDTILATKLNLLTMYKTTHIKKTIISMLLSVINYKQYSFFIYILEKCFLITTCIMMYVVSDGSLTTKRLCRSSYCCMFMNQQPPPVTRKHVFKILKKAFLYTTCIVMSVIIKSLLAEMLLKKYILLRENRCLLFKYFRYILVKF